MNTAEERIKEYLDKLSSSKAVPGGGGASALAAAFSTALALMLANLTVNKKNLKCDKEKINDIIKRMEEKKKFFIEASDRDAEVFLPLSKAYKLPSSTEAERKYKADVMEKELINAASLPLDIIRELHKMLPDFNFLLKYGNNLVLSDLGVAASFLRTAAEGSLMNVLINASMMKDRERGDEFIKEGVSLKDIVLNETENIYEEISRKILK